MIKKKGRKDTVKVRFQLYRIVAGSRFVANPTLRWFSKHFLKCIGDLKLCFSNGKILTLNKLNTSLKRTMAKRYSVSIRQRDIRFAEGKEIFGFSEGKEISVLQKAKSYSVF